MRVELIDLRGNQNDLLLDYESEVVPRKGEEILLEGEHPRLAIVKSVQHVFNKNGDNYKIEVRII